MKQLEDKINIVKNDIFKRFPNCNYTVSILLWDDGTDKVECRHGTKYKIFISSLYNNELKYEEIDVNLNNGIMIDKEGTEYYPKLNN